MPPKPEKFPDTLVLVPNQAVYRLRLGQWWREQGAPEAAAVPALRVLSQWVGELVTRCTLLAGEALPTAARPAAELRSWERAMVADTDGWLAAERRVLARRAMAAERLLEQWWPGAPPTDGSVNWNRFLRWRERVVAERAGQGRCATGWATRRMPELLAGGRVPAGLLPRTLRLAGFVEFTRAETRLFEALEQAGVMIERESNGAANTTADARVFERPEAEWRAAAAWAAAQCAAGVVPVAVVVNDLESVHGAVRRAFEDALEAPAMLGLSAGEGRIHFGVGEPLASHPLVDAALRLLRLTLDGPRRHHEFAVLSRLLLEPAWTGAATERFALAALEHRLRERGDARLNLARLSALAAEHGCPVLVEKLARLTSWRPGQGAGRQFADWLDHWGWPGIPEPDAVTRGTLDRFAACLERLGDDPGLSAEEALAELLELAQSESREQAGGAASPVQVITPEQAIGCRFAAAWLANFTDRNYPGPVQRNPLLPPRVQAAIPRATPEGRLAFAQAVMDALQACADESVVSWSRQDEGVPQGPSPLLPAAWVAAPQTPADAPVPSLALAAFPQAQGLSGYAGHPWLRAAEGTGGRPVTQSPLALRAALNMLELQSACPWAAFMAHRLQARFEAVPEPFPSPVYAGLLVHRALEALHRPHVGADTRPAPGEIPAAVDAALARSQADFRLLPAALRAERRRLESLLHEWLEFDAGRPAGVLVDLERELSADWAGLRFGVRLDRLELQADGRHLVIDYKTGALRPDRWGEARPSELQLPLYAVLLAQHGEAPPGGIALVSLRSGEVKARGLTSDAGSVANGISEVADSNIPFTSWEEALANWSECLGALAGEFLRGECEHRVYFEPPLQYAGLEPLQRTAERVAWLRARGEA